MIAKDRVLKIRKALAPQIRVRTSTLEQIDRISFEWVNMYYKWEAIDKIVMQHFNKAVMDSKTFGKFGGILQYHLEK